MKKKEMLEPGVFGYPFNIEEFYREHVEDAPDEYRVAFIRFEYVRRNSEYWNDWLYLKTYVPEISDEDLQAGKISFPMGARPLLEQMHKRWQIKSVLYPAYPLPRRFIPELNQSGRDRKRDLEERGVKDRGIEEGEYSTMMEYWEEEHSLQECRDDYFDHKEVKYRKDNDIVVKLNARKLMKGEKQEISPGIGKWVAVFINLQAGRQAIIKEMENKGVLPRKPSSFDAFAHVLRIRAYDLREAGYPNRQIAECLQRDERQIKRYVKQARQYIAGKYITIF
ncbi:MAG: hypothetical protein ABIH23_04410 [bacterium]